MEENILKELHIQREYNLYDHPGGDSVFYQSSDFLLSEENYGKVSSTSSLGDGLSITFTKDAGQCSELVPVRPNNLKRRKYEQKEYEDDPVEEKKRQDAINAKKNRDKKKSEMEAKDRDILKLKEEVDFWKDKHRIVSETNMELSKQHIELHRKHLELTKFCHKLQKDLEKNMREVEERDKKSQEINEIINNNLPMLTGMDISQIEDSEINSQE